MSTRIQQVEEIARLFRTEGNIIERDYKSIGGMWTVERYQHPKFPDVEVQLQDEGATDVVLNTQMHVATTYGRDVVYYKGDEAVLEALHARIFGGTTE